MPSGNTNTALKTEGGADIEALLAEYKSKLDAMNRTRPMVEFGLDGVIVDVNDRFLHVMGYGREDVIGKHHDMFVDPVERQGLDHKGFWDRLARGEDFTGEFRRFAKGAREVWLQGGCTPIVGPDGRTTSIVEFGADITEDVHSRDAAAKLESAVRHLTTSVMMIDRDLVVTYVNESTMALLRNNAAEFRTMWPGFDPEKIVGACIDQFHKDPSHQRRLLADPSNLPHRAEITVGSLKISLCINGNFDATGAYVGNSLEWADITEFKKNQELNNDYKNLSDAISKSQAVIEFTLDGIVVDANENFLNTLGYTLPEIVGKHHSMFVDKEEVASPAYRKFWEDLAAGQYQSAQFRRISKTGQDVWIQASYNPVNGLDGKPAKVVKYATDVTPQRNVAIRVKEISQIVASASSEMRATAENLARTASLSTQQATAVAAAAEEASANVQTVSAASEELSASISEIARQVTESTNITQRAVAETDKTSAAIQSLAEAAHKIGNVVTLINNIAGQTKLLALNATIEAARAGDAGKGFAVVASEVKSLSDQTAKATHEISSEVSAMQAATATSVAAIQGIADTIGKVAEIASAIASAVEEQSAATGEISANVTEAAASTRDVTANIIAVNEGVAQTSDASAELLSASGELAVQSEALSNEMDKLLR